MNVLTCQQSYSPKWRELSKLYLINSLSFDGEYAIKNSSYIKEFLMPTDTMTSPDNPAATYLWERYKASALYTNYPNQFLKQALGLIAKAGFEYNLPGNMIKLIDYATETNLSLEQVYFEVLTNILKFGSTAIVTVISDNLKTSEQTPKLKVIPGSNILDADTFFDFNLGVERLKRLVYYEVENNFNEESNIYELSQVYLTVQGLDAEGKYYIAKMKEANYSRFNLNHPVQSLSLCESLSYPTWFNTLNVIPSVIITKTSLKPDWLESPIQNLIETSLSIFQLTADLRFLLHQQSSATLVIAGTDLEDASVRTGIGNVLNLTTQGANASFIAPSTSGLDAMQKTLNEQHQLAQNSLLTLTDVGKDASGEALSLRLQDKLSELAGLVNVIGNGIQRELELVAEIMGENIDGVEFTPSTEFVLFDSEETLETKIEKVEE